MIETMTEDLMNDMGSDSEISGAKLFALFFYTSLWDVVVISDWKLLLNEWKYNAVYLSFMK